MPKGVKAGFLSVSLMLGLTLITPAQSFGQELSIDAELQALDTNALYGHIRSRNQATLSSEIAAKIAEIPFRDGESFKKGDLLVRFDCRLLKTQRAKARAVVDGAKKKFDSEQRLMKLQSGGRLEFDLSAAKLAEARADLASIQTRIDMCDLKAPYDGRVVAQQVGEHEFMQTGAAIIDIIETADLEIEFIVPSQWVNQLNVGTEFEFEVNETKKKYKAQVVRRGAVVDPVSRTITLIGRFENVTDELIAGMSGYVHLKEGAVNGPA